LEKASLVRRYRAIETTAFAKEILENVDEF